MCILACPNEIGIVLLVLFFKVFANTEAWRIRELNKLCSVALRRNEKRKAE